MGTLRALKDQELVTEGEDLRMQRDPGAGLCRIEQHSEKMMANMP